jgi:Sortilin, neurotensin receptor 3, C-terminal
MCISDYNYELTTDNTCALVPGEESLDPVQVCKDDPNRMSYFDSQGFRKIPISTCHGGEVGRYFGEEKPCPGHEPEFADAQPGLRGFGLFVVAFVIPVVAAGGVGYWIWTRWDGKFGRIRLGETSAGAPRWAMTDAWDKDQPWIKYPVAVAAGAIAVAASLPLLVGAVWRSISTRWFGGRRYTTRESFARSRGEYAVVDPVEDELLGEDDEEF